MIEKMDITNTLYGIKFEENVGDDVFDIRFPDLTFEQFDALFKPEAQDAILAEIWARKGGLL